MLNTGLRTGEALGLKNSDVDLENRMLYVQHAVKEVSRRNGAEKQKGKELITGKPKSATSKRAIPLNSSAIEMIKDLRKEMYFGEDSPLIPDENGQFTKPSNFRKRFYRILEACGVKEKSKTKGTGNNSTKGKTQGKGLHSLRHPYVKLKTKKFRDFWSKKPTFRITLSSAFVFAPSETNRARENLLLHSLFQFDCP